MSMSTPAVAASIVAWSLSAATPWFIISVMAFQSLTSTPSNLQRSRSTSRMSQLLPDEGTPFMSLNDVMNVATPAPAAASNGGSTTSSSRGRGSQVVL